MEAIGTRGWLVAATAPVLWGSTYFVTRHYLPADLPLTGSAIRALPAGAVLLALRPGLPKGSWWWKSALISALTVGGFFVLIYVAGQRLPSGLASVLMATSTLAMILFAWGLLGQRPRPIALVGAVAGIAGVALLVNGSAGTLDFWGIVASFVAMASSCLGYVLTARWQPPVSPVTFTGWQLVLGGLVLVPIALLVEGPPRAFTGVEIAGFAYLTLLATALANAAWFVSLTRLSPATMGFIGLLNPLSGVALGVALDNETFTWAQLGGAALVIGGIVVGTSRRKPGGGTKAGEAPLSTRSGRECAAQPGVGNAARAQSEPRPPRPLHRS